MELLIIPGRCVTANILIVVLIIQILQRLTHPKQKKFYNLPK